MTTQLEALRLAEALENTPNWQKEEWNSDWKASVMHFSRVPFEAAAELRRLHEELQATERQVEILSDDLSRCSKINRELLEALIEAKRCLEWHVERHGVGMDAQAVHQARAAIAKATLDDLLREKNT